MKLAMPLMRDEEQAECCAEFIGGDLHHHLSDHHSLHIILDIHRLSLRIQRVDSM
jgi:hypothetical protein